MFIKNNESIPRTSAQKCFKEKTVLIQEVGEIQPMIQGLNKIQEPGTTCNSTLHYSSKCSIHYFVDNFKGKMNHYIRKRILSGARLYIWLLCNLNEGHQDTLYINNLKKNWKLNSGCRGFERNLCKQTTSYNGVSLLRYLSIIVLMEILIHLKAMNYDEPCNTLSCV